MRPLEERLNELQQKIIDPKFLENRGLGNEVGFYIFDYQPADELLIRREVAQMISFSEKRHDLTIKEYDLYKIMLSFFEKRKYMDRNFQMEEAKGSDDLFNKMRKALKVATERDEIIQYIASHLSDEDIVFITGVGKAYPILRSHVILNNLQTIVDDRPLVMFYPGAYEYNSLRLFDQFHDDNYYRAFKIVE